MVACREYETFSEAKGGACSLRGVGAAWGVQLGKIGGAGADQGSAGEAWGVGRVEKSKNGINSYGYCFLVAFWYVETRKNIFFGQRKFFVGWNLT